MKSEYKVTTIGESGAGKTSILIRFNTGIFNDFSIPTIGSQNLYSTVTINDKVINLNLWDTAGQEQYSSLLPIYMKGSSATLFVFDISSHDRFEYLRRLYKSIIDEISPDTPKFLVGNKCDLVENDISCEEFENFAKENNMIFMEVSAKTGKNVNRLFMQIAERCMEIEKMQTNDKEINIVITKSNKNKRQNECC